MMITKRFLLITAFFLMGISLSAQEGCAFLLEEAQDMFDAGLIESIPEKLSGCLEKGFTSEEKLQAYKLIILSYLFDDNFEEADSVMLAFLSDYPAYEPVATDPREFVALLESYDRRPVLMIGGSLGINFTFPLSFGNLGVYNLERYNGRYVPGGAGFHASFKADRRINENITVTGGLTYSYYRFDYYLGTDPEPQQFTGEVTDFSVIDYYETQNRLNIPLSISYNWMEGELKPVIIAGVSPGILVSATGDSFREYVNTGDVRFDPVIVSNVDMMPVRRFFSVNAFAGMGINYKLGPGEFFMDAIYHFNFFNQVPADADRFIQKLAFASYYVSDNLFLNHVTISAGFMFPIYHPQKIE